MKKTVTLTIRNNELEYFLENIPLVQYKKFTSLSVYIFGQVIRLPFVKSTEDSELFKTDFLYNTLMVEFTFEKNFTNSGDFDEESQAKKSKSGIPERLKTE